MFRLLLIALMLLQPLQWAWAEVHVTLDAAHAVSHKHVATTIPSFESIAACSLMGDVADGHSCHDNHTHNTTVLGLIATIDPVSGPAISGKNISAHAVLLASPVAADIERPKWIATR
ncbi:MAG: hypothetical protein ACKVOT_15590 [Polaromonas sp.]